MEEALGQASDLRGQLEDLLKQLEKLRTQLANHKPPRVQSTQLEKQIKDLAVCSCTHACQSHRHLCSVAWRMPASLCIDNTILHLTSLHLKLRILRSFMAMCYSSIAVVAHEFCTAHCRRLRVSSLTSSPRWRQQRRKVLPLPLLILVPHLLLKVHTHTHSTLFQCACTNLTHVQLYGF